MSGISKQALLAAAITGAMGGAAQADEQELRDKMRYLEERVQLLEQERVVREEPINAESPLTFGGLVEVEAISGEDHEGTDSSDVVLATVELFAEAHVNDWTQAQVVYLFEEDDTEPGEIDQAILTFGNPEASPLYLSAGRMYVPFGRFETAMVSDPLTLELGETRESALQVGFDTGDFYGSVFAFNGDTRETGDDDEIEHFGSNVGWASEYDGFDLAFGVGYISSLADSDGISGAFEDNGVDSEALTDLPSGVTGDVIFNTGPWTLIGEYTGANEEFDATDLAFKGDGARPTAWNLEVGYVFTLLGRDASVGIARQETAEAVALGLPESKTLAALSVGVMENAAISLEYAFAEDYDVGDGGSGEDGGIFTLQLAAEF